jgi:hypothetical protein
MPPLLALATLGGTTNDRNDPLSVASPEVAKVSTVVTVTCYYHLSLTVLLTIFANVNDVLTLSSIKGAFTLARFRGQFCTKLARLVMNFF